MAAHQNDTKNFEELTYEQQAHSLTIQIQNLKSQILAHHKRGVSERKADSTSKYISQLETIIREINEI